MVRRTVSWCQKGQPMWKSLMSAVIVVLTVTGGAAAQCGPEPAKARTAAGECLRAKKAAGGPVVYGFYTGSCKWWSNDAATLAACGMRASKARGSAGASAYARCLRNPYAGWAPREVVRG